MYPILFVLACMTTVVKCSDKVFLPLVPEAVKFTSGDAIKSSQLADVLSGIMGYSVRTDDPWNALAPVLPFQSPRTAVILDLDGYDPDTVLDVSGPNFPLENNVDPEDQFQILMERTSKRFSDKGPVVFYMKTGEQLYDHKRAYPDLLLSVSPEADTRLSESTKDSDLGKAVRDGIFNCSLSGDDRFLTELYTAIKVIEEVGKQTQKGAAPTIVWLKLEGLRGIVDRYLEESYQASHAQRLIRTLIDRAKKILSQSHNQRAVLMVITQNDKNAALIRKGRSLLQEPVQLSEESLRFQEQRLMAAAEWNLAVDTDPDFHVSFALLAFVSISLILMVFGISVGLWFIDPGRDSIIYRLTLQRVKRD
uniref:Putative secreted peptide n=1 Tax=Ornithodoros turicata TaxID=34597 RepID=A0A2R5LL46_9ACAR